MRPIGRGRVPALLAWSSVAAVMIVPVAIEEGLRFAIREGGRTVGAGVVTSITQ